MLDVNLQKYCRCCCCDYYYYYYYYYYYLLLLLLLLLLLHVHVLLLLLVLFLSVQFRCQPLPEWYPHLLKFLLKGSLSACPLNLKLPGSLSRRWWRVNCFFHVPWNLPAPSVGRSDSRSLLLPTEVSLITASLSERLSQRR